MNFDHSDKTKELIARVEKFMDENVYPNESVYEEQMQAFGENRWQIPQILEDLYQHILISPIESGFQACCRNYVQPIKVCTIQVAYMC
jgi:alkylation response protein AidB-like acyl-CoA dehydrogenase